MKTAFCKQNHWSLSLTLKIIKPPQKKKRKKKVGFIKLIFLYSCLTDAVLNYTQLFLIESCQSYIKSIKHK